MHRPMWTYSIDTDTDTDTMHPYPGSLIVQTNHSMLITGTPVSHSNLDMNRNLFGDFVPVIACTCCNV